MTLPNKTVFKTEIETSLETLPLSKKGMYAFKLERRYAKSFGLHGRLKTPGSSKDETISNVQGVTDEKTIKEFNDGKRETIMPLNVVLTSNKLLKEGARDKEIDLHDEKATEKLLETLKSGRRTEDHLLTYNPNTDEYSNFNSGTLVGRPIEINNPLVFNNKEYDLEKAKAVVHAWASLHGYDTETHLDSIPYYLGIDAQKALQITLYPTQEQMEDFTHKKKSPEALLEKMLTLELKSTKKPHVKVSQSQDYSF